jgi:hypothetical protein
MRALLHREARVVALEDFAHAPPAFDAAVYPSLVVAHRAASSAAPLPAPRLDVPPAAGDERGERADDAGRVQLALHRPHRTLGWEVARARLPLADPASPWLLVPADVRAAFDRVAHRGVPLADSALGRPLLGVKCGYNDAFVVETVGRSDDESGAPLGSADAGAARVRVRAGSREGCVEAHCLRPLVRGERVLPWSADAGSARLVWTHDARGGPRRVLPPGVAAWLDPARARLARRSDRRGGAPWWTLFRTEAADDRLPRVVWCDIGRAPRAAVLPAGDASVPLNSCYVVRCPSLDDAHARAALLNSAVAAAWLALIAEPARGGYHRYLGWTTALLPVPRGWARARDALAPLGARAAAGDAPARDELLAAVLDAYALRASSAAPLLAWNDG